MKRIFINTRNLFVGFSISAVVVGVFSFNEALLAQTPPRYTQEMEDNALKEAVAASEVAQKEFERQREVIERDVKLMNNRETNTRASIAEIRQRMNQNKREEKKDPYKPWFMTTEQKAEYYKKLDEYEKYTVQVASIQRDIDAEEKKLSDTQNRVSKLYGNIESANQRLLGPAQKAVNDVDKLKLNNDRLVQNLQNELKITALSSKVESIRSRFESNSINAQIIGDYYDDKILGMYTQAKIAKAMSPASLCIAMAAAKKDGKCPAESPQLSPPGGVLDEDANVGHSKK